MSFASSGSSQQYQGRQDNYFSLDDILATNEKMLCRFEVPLLHLGYLNPSSDSENIDVGTKLDLPFWLAKSLCTRKKHLVTVDLPKQFKEGYREILSADANVVDLHKLGPYFYEFGTYLLHFEHPESLDIAKTLLQAFQARLRQIMDSSQNIYNTDVSVITERLDAWERRVFASGQRGLSDIMRWEQRQTEKLSTSTMVLNHRKRKRATMEML